MTWVRAQIEFYLRGFSFSVRKNKGIHNKILMVIQKIWIRDEQICEKNK